jgi:4-amino-4-deoxy-L-arabinose transferase-like glycosyltransferase
MGKTWILGVAIVTLAALALRLIAIDFHSFWFDEAYTAQITEFSFVDLSQGRVLDPGNPPLYWLTAKAWSALFGRSEVGFRSLSVLCSVLTIPIIASLGRRLLGAKTGLWAAGLLAISPLAIELSEEARVYSLLGLLIALNTWFFVRWLDGHGLTDLVFYSLTTFLSCYSHYYALLVPFSHFTCLLFSGPSKRLIVTWVAAMAAAALLWAIWLPAFWEMIHRPGNMARLSAHWPFQFLATPVAFSLGRTFAWRDSATWLLGLAAVGTIIGFGVPAIWGLWQLGRRRMAGPLLAGWLLFPIVLPLIVAILRTPIYHVRAASVGLSAFLLLTAYGLTLMRLPWRVGFVGVIVTMTGISLFRYSTEPLKDDWRSATQVVLSQAKAGQPIVFDNDTEVISFDYYVPRFGRMPQEMLAILSAQPDHILAVKYEDGRRTDKEAQDHFKEIFSAPECWLVLCVPSQPSEFYEALFEKRGYLIEEHYHFQRIDIYRFGKVDEKSNHSRYGLN